MLSVQVGMLAKKQNAPAPKQKKRNRRRKNNGAVPAGFGRPNTNAGTNNVGEIVVSRTEQLTSLQMSAANKGLGYVNLYPDASTMAWLHKLRSAFDRIEWLSATLHWKPFVGTNSGGSVAFGVDWNSSIVVKDATREKVLACTPVYESPVWQSGNLVLPQRMLMTRRVYLLESSIDADRMPGKLIWNLSGIDASDAVTKGEIWITYKVRLSGTTA